MKPDSTTSVLLFADIYVIPTFSLLLINALSQTSCQYSVYHTHLCSH